MMIERVPPRACARARTLGPPIGYRREMRSLDIGPTPKKQLGALGAKGAKDGQFGMWIALTKADNF